MDADHGSDDDNVSQPPAIDLTLLQKYHMGDPTMYLTSSLHKPADVAMLEYSQLSYSTMAPLSLAIMTYLVDAVRGDDSSAVLPSVLLNKRVSKALHSKFGPLSIEFTNERGYWISQKWAGIFLFSMHNYADIHTVMQKYAAEANGQPATSRALFILPDWPSARWFRALWDNPAFTLISYYLAGSKLF